MAKAPPQNVVSLERYRARRDFSRTPEPDARAVADAAEAEGRLFCLQQHAARRMHFDLRLQFGDALKSWAVPQGPSLDPKVRRLAVHVEDHPLDYARFEGVIPKGQYGAGQVIVWDLGRWVPMGDPEEGYAKGNLKFRLLGEKLKGGYALIQIKGDRERGDNWLLIKERDIEARAQDELDIVRERPESVLSGRPVEALGEGDPIWSSREGLLPPAPAAKPRRKGLRPAALPGAKRAALPARPPPPQLATPVASPPEGEEWLHEIKLDGYRTMARIDKGTVRLFTRSGHDWTDRYGALADGFRGLPCKAALIDGEIVVQGEDGRTSFPALQDALASGKAHELTFFAFDLLHLDGVDLCEVPLGQRKETLHGLIGPALTPTSALQYSEHLQGQGPAFFAQAGEMGLEGVISKRVDCPYRSGRGRAWLKAKCMLRDEFVVVGFARSPAAGGLGALLVAEAGDDGLRYAGRVGTGFSAAEAKRLLARLEPLVRKTPPVKIPPEDRRKDVAFVRPALLAEVRYMSRTSDGLLRHAVYQGLREDKTEAAPAPAAPPAPAPRQRLIGDAELASIWVTNPERQMLGGPTKLELALYYARVGDWMLPQILGRPVSLVRCPSGKAEDCFFQRHAMAGMPESVKTIDLAEKGGKERGAYLYFEDAAGFLALPQFGAVEFHAWGCRVDKPERPDRVIFDLDPDEGLPWRVVVEAAGEVRAALADLGLVPFVKTTGGKGIHVVVPLERRSAWKDVEAFCKAFATTCATRSPRRFTANMAKRERRGRIYLDWLRNTRGATAVAAYSLRARPGVTVSTPLSWQELADLDDPRELDYASVPARLEGGAADPWATIEDAARSLTKEMQRTLGIRA